MLTLERDRLSVPQQIETIHHVFIDFSPCIRRLHYFISCHGALKIVYCINGKYLCIDNEPFNLFVLWKQIVVIKMQSSLGTYLSVF